LRSEETASLVVGWQQTTDLEAVVWDGASSHQSGAVQEVGFPLVQQPAYALELNPAERNRRRAEAARAKYGASSVSEGSGKFSKQGVKTNVHES
jgi:hypothetical protein